MPAKNAGFTLIELLVVISIIGFLSTVVIASLNSVRIKGRDTRRIADLRQIRTALELYYNTNGNYPDCLYAGNNNAGSSCGSAVLEGSGFISAVPKDPLTNLNYSYAHLRRPVSGSCSSPWTYHLGASLEMHSNPALTTDDDATDYHIANGGRCNSATNYDFWGLSAAAGGQPCNANGAGDTSGGTTANETCYDLSPNP